MNAYEIFYELKDEHCFKGVYSLDEIKNLKIQQRPFSIVINLDYSDEPGSHWVALFVDEKNIAIYFDSFGFPNFNEYFLNFLKINKINTVYCNRFHLQANYSKTCGAYCILFIKMCCNGFSFNEFIKLFSNNKEKNDLISIKIVGDA